MKIIYVLASMALMLLTLSSAPVTAQSRPGAVTRVRVDPVASRRSDFGVYDHRRVGKKGPGPAFCRNGRGHPVHGWSWCVRKGWAGYAPARPVRVRWERVWWGRVDLYAPRGVGRLGWVDAHRFLDRRVLMRLERRRAHMGLRGELVVRWVRDYGGETVVQVRAGGFLMAEMRDQDRDGFADLVLLARL